MKRPRRYTIDNVILTWRLVGEKLECFIERLPRKVTSRRATERLLSGYDAPPASLRGQLFMSERSGIRAVDPANGRAPRALLSYKLALLHLQHLHHSSVAEVLDEAPDLRL